MPEEFREKIQNIDSVGEFLRFMALDVATNFISKESKYDKIEKEINENERIRRFE